MSAFKALRVNHVTQRALACNLIQTQGDSTKRASLLSEFKCERAAHGAADKRFSLCAADCA